MEVLSKKDIDDLLNSVKFSEETKNQEKLSNAEIVQLLASTMANELEDYYRDEIDASTDTTQKATGKLTKLGQGIISRGNKLRTNVANQWHALRNINKKRKFLQWCKEQNILMVHVDGGTVDYEELQWLIQDSINHFDQTVRADAIRHINSSAANDTTVNEINKNANDESSREM